MTRRLTAIAGLVSLVALAVVVSIAVGSKGLSPGRVVEVLLTRDSSAETVVVWDLRVPRTVVGVLAGAALGAAGALMQSLTRNPLADPGILGINAGAAFAVVVGAAVTGVMSVGVTVWFALAGALVAVVAVHLLGNAGPAGGTPGRIALAGVAITAAVGALVQTVILADQAVFNEFRFWASGSLEGQGLSVSARVAPFVVLGLLVAAALGPGLNALALGDDTGRALGVNVARTRALTVGAVALMCAGATAAVGPIAFVGLGVPHVARALVGSDQRWVLPCSVLLGAAFLLLADVLGRVLAGQEIPAGIVTAILGGPAFVAVVRRRRRIEAL